MGTPLRAGRADASSRNWGPHGAHQTARQRAGSLSMDPVRMPQQAIDRAGGGWMERVPASRWRFSIDALAVDDVTDPPVSAL